MKMCERKKAPCHWLGGGWHSMRLDGPLSGWRFRYDRLIGSSAEECALEEENNDDSGGDGRVGEVKYGWKNLPCAAINGDGFGDVKHIHHVAHEYRGVALAVHLGQTDIPTAVVVRRADVKEPSVHRAIYDVAQGTGDDEGYAEYVTLVGALFHQSEQVE